MILYASASCFLINLKYNSDTLIYLQQNKLDTSVYLNYLHKIIILKNKRCNQTKIDKYLIDTNSR